MMQSVYLQPIMKKNTDIGCEKQSQNKPNFEKRRFKLCANYPIINRYRTSGKESKE